MWLFVKQAKLSLWKTLGKMCKDPTVLHAASVEGKVLPTCLVSALLLSPGAVGVWDGLF